MHECYIPVIRAFELDLNHGYPIRFSKLELEPADVARIEFGRMNFGKFLGRDAGEESHVSSLVRDIASVVQMYENQAYGESGRKHQRDRLGPISVVQKIGRISKEPDCIMYPIRKPT